MAYLTQISTSTLSNQNISSALLVHTFTNTTRDRKLLINVLLDQIQGNGNYVFYATRQVAGAGSAYEWGPRTTVAVPSGITAQGCPSIVLDVDATDVIKLYVVGLAGDTTTVDIITKVKEEFVNVDASGNVTVGAIVAGVIAAAAFAANALDAVWSTTSRTLSAFGFSVTVGTNNDKTGYALSAAGVLAIWNQLRADVGIVANSFGARLRDWVLGADSKALISTDVQDVSATLSVNAKLLNGATPNNLAAGALMGLVDDAITNAKIATDAIGAAELAASAITEIQSGLSTLTEAGVRTALGMTTNNLDTQLTAIDDFLDTEITDIRNRLPAALVGGRMDASVGAMATDVLTAAALAADAVTEIQAGLSTLNAAGIRSAVGLTTADLDVQLDAILAASGGGGGGSAPTVEEMEAYFAGLHGAGSWVSGGGATFPAGAIEFTYTVTDSDTMLPLEGVGVWFATDLAGSNIVWKGSTDTFGVARDVNEELPQLDAGTYYVRRQKGSYTFVNPDTEVVS